MVLDAGIPKEDLSSFVSIGTSTAPLDPTVQYAFEKHHGIPIISSFGATEFGGPVTLMTVEMRKEWAMPSSAASAKLPSAQRCA